MLLLLFLLLVEFDKEYVDSSNIEEVEEVEVEEDELLVIELEVLEDDDKEDDDVVPLNLFLLPLLLQEEIVVEIVESLFSAELWL